jgi:MFS family permease
VFFATFAYGAAPAAIQVMTPPRTRALASAVYLFFLNLVGMGIGPLFAALVTDRVFRDELAVGRSLSLVMGIAGLLSALLLWRGLAAFRKAVTDARGPVATP